MQEVSFVSPAAKARLGALKSTLREAPTTPNGFKSTGNLPRATLASSDSEMANVRCRANFSWPTALLLVAYRRRDGKAVTGKP
jgi:hypothetical protein